MKVYKFPPHVVSALNADLSLVERLHLGMTPLQVMELAHDAVDVALTADQKHRDQESATHGCCRFCPGHPESVVIDA